MKKRILALIMSIVLLVPMLAGSVVYAQDNITVMIDGEKVYFDVEPMEINGRIMVPMRAIFEKLGATVEWKEKTQLIIAKKGMQMISLRIGDNLMTVNTKFIYLDVEPIEINGRTLVPVRAISEAFGLNVEWVNATQTVLITTPTNEKFDQLKDIVLRNGDVEDGYINLDLASFSENNLYGIIYYPEKEEMLFYSAIKGEDGVALCTISAYYTGNPTLYHTYKMPNGENYQMTCYYPTLNQPYVEMSNSYPKTSKDAIYRLVTASIKAIDASLLFQTGMSIKDFGVYYEE